MDFNNCNKFLVGLYVYCCFSFVFVAITLVLPVLVHSQVTTCSKYCTPSLSCWPSQDEIIAFVSSMTAGAQGVLHPGHPNYTMAAEMKDLLYTKKVAMIVYVLNTQDIQNAMMFTQKYNIRLTIRSSGHSYIGRSTAADSLMMDTSYMNDIVVNLSDVDHENGTVTVEPGNAWLRVYEEVDKYNRLVVGGSAHTVSVSGYTMGGGHSPLTRSLGLAVDNVLAFTIVTADGLIRECTASGMTTTNKDGTKTMSSNTDLFWAVRGGGGGTFGVVTSFKFKLHMPPPSFIRLVCSFPYDLDDGTVVGDSVLDVYYSLVTNMPNEWGGYLITGSNADPAVTTHGHLIFAMLHFGGWEAPSSMYLQPLKTLYENYGPACQYLNYTTFLEYERTTVDAIYVRTYISNTFLQPSSFTQELTNLYRDGTFMNPLARKAYYSCVGIHVGGKGSEEPVPAAISPAFRSSLSATTCAVGWKNTKDDAEIIADMDAFQTKFSKLGNGSYINEPSANLRNWKVDFWGGHYDRLLAIKHEYDPENFFTCLQCVGSDEPRPSFCYTAGQSELRSSVAVTACLTLILVGLQHLI